MSLEELAAEAYESTDVEVVITDCQVEVLADGASLCVAWSRNEALSLIREHLSALVRLKASRPWARRGWRDPLDLARELLDGGLAPDQAKDE